METTETTTAPRKGRLFTPELARELGARGNAKQARARELAASGDDGITKQLLSKASRAVSSLNERELKPADALRLADVATNIAGLRRQAPAAEDTLDDRILRAYREAGEEP